MSRAFVKEDAGQPDEDPPERPVSIVPNFCTPRGLALLRAAEERLLSELRGFSGVQSDASRRRRKRELERDLRYVKTRLESAIPVEPRNQPQGEARLCAVVELKSDKGETRRIRIVGEDESGAWGPLGAAEPEPGVELMAWSAPFLQLLLGLKPGQSLDWSGESGPERWTVVSAEYL